MHQPSLTPSISSVTIRTCYDSLSDPPDYISPFSRSLRLDTCGLTRPSNARTRTPFKPRSAARGSGSYQLRQFAEATLGSGSLRKAVRLPEGEDLNEWLAVNGGLLLRILGNIPAS
jgi:MOB kinase activator 1